MKKIITFIVIIFSLFSCTKEESYIYEGESTIAFAKNNINIQLNEGITKDSILPVEVQLIGVQQDSEIKVSIKSTIKNGEHITYPETLSIPPNSSSSVFLVTIHSTQFNINEELKGAFTISAQGLEVSNNLNHFMVTVKMNPLPQCIPETSKYLGPYSVASTDPWGTYNPAGNGNIALRTDPKIPNRLLHDNFYGWSKEEGNQAIYFDLFCGDANTITVPEQQYTTPGGYSITITGGTGTYNSSTKNMTITFNVNNPNDGDFTIVETFTFNSTCTIDIAAFLGPHSVSSTDPWGTYNPAGNGNILLTEDSNVPLRLIHKNFYGWSEGEGNPAIYFDLSCNSNNITVPAQEYTSPGGYFITITGGSGTYDVSTGNMNITFNVNNSNDGDFSIVESFTKQ